MLREINRGSGDNFGNLERQWRDLLAKDPHSSITVDIRPQYAAASTVPRRIVVDYQISGGDVVRKVFRNG